MKIIDGFKLRKVAGEMVVSGEGIAQVNFNKLISLNETAAYLWQSIEGREFSVETLADLLVAEYDIDRERALSDSAAISQSWLEVGVIQE